MCQGNNLDALISAQKVNYRGNFFHDNRRFPVFLPEKRGVFTFRLIFTTVVSFSLILSWSAHARSECVWSVEKGWLVARNGENPLFRAR